MKNRPLIIAAVVTVAAIACMVAVWTEAWFGFAYEKQETSYRVQYLKKRFSWVPGSRWLPIDHVCRPCVGGNCSACLLGWEMIVFADRFYLSTMRKGGAPTQNLSAYCNCTTCHPERQR